MQGYAALWLPRDGPRGYRDTERRGTRAAEKKELTRHDLGREAFIEQRVGVEGQSQETRSAQTDAKTR